MDMFYIGFRDPLFSVIIFFTIIFVITFFSYWWGRYKRKEDSNHLDKFLEQFRALPTKTELKVLISSGELSEKSWLLLATSYSKNGDYEKSIDIYNEILKLTSKTKANETMFLLGKTYFKAGFLERSKQIFLEILKHNPRTPQALHYLLLVYEYMRDYKAALDVLEPLDELQEDILLDEMYLKALALLNDSKLSEEEKSRKLLEIYKKSSRLAYMIFEYLFKVNPKIAWDNFDLCKSELLTEVLWKIDLKDLNLDIISNNEYLKDLYSARGDVKYSQASSVFELDVLIKIKGRVNATLSFEYVCSNCKGTYPFAFNRCSSCHAIDTAMVEYTLSKDYVKEYSEENNSFQ
ncbi:tetratricopeptide repeat protein [Sulfurimonas sp.]